MDDWEIVSIESELDRLRDEKEKSAPTRNSFASGSKLSFGKVLLYFVLGILIFRIFIEVISILSR
jgi:hypothetical protein